MYALRESKRCGASTVTADGPNKLTYRWEAAAFRPYIRTAAFLFGIVPVVSPGAAHCAQRPGGTSSKHELGCSPRSRGPLHGPLRRKNPIPYRGGMRWYIGQYNGCAAVAWSMGHDGDSIIREHQSSQRLRKDEATNKACDAAALVFKWTIRTASPPSSRTVVGRKSRQVCF